MHGHLNVKNRKKFKVTYNFSERQRSFSILHFTVHVPATTFRWSVRTQKLLTSKKTTRLKTCVTICFMYSVAYISKQSTKLCDINIQCTSRLS